jgi:hypothetical protein
MLMAVMLLVGSTVNWRDAGSPVELGGKIAFGKGSVSTYATFDDAGNPSAMGVMFDAAALNSPPPGVSDEHHCWDRNGDGQIQKPDECEATHEFVIPLPDKMARRDDVPFKWVLLNWNPVGHIPPGIYDTPHFDIHFMMAPVAEIFSIYPGACGPEFVDCGQFAMARKPLPANYVPAEFKDVEAVVPAMGNHMIDVTGPEFNGVPFTRSFIYGAYDGKVTFWEEMPTVKYLLSKPDSCDSIKSPEGVAESGYYPTKVCVGYNTDQDAYTVSMEDFQHRDASPPAPPRPPEPAPASPVKH